MVYKKIINYLNNCIKDNTLSHAYIFYGPDETSKIKAAFLFANNILKNKDEKFHPDLFSFKPGVFSDISIDLIRQMKKFLSLRPHSAEYKVVVIENAENLNDYAQNAILKIFEEAPIHAVIILCVKTLDSICETMVSRGVKLPFWQTTIQKKEELFDIFEEIIKSNNFSDFENLNNNYKTPAVFESWLKFLRNKFLLNPEDALLSLLKISQNIYFKLNETNINPRLAYDELFINLQHDLWIHQKI